MKNSDLKILLSKYKQILVKNKEGKVLASYPNKLLNDSIQNVLDLKEFIDNCITLYDDPKLTLEGAE